MKDTKFNALFPPPLGISLVGFTVGAFCIHLYFAPLDAHGFENGQNPNVQKETFAPVSIEAQRPIEPVTSPLAIPESARSGEEIFDEREVEAIHPRNVFDIIDLGTDALSIYQGRKSQYSIRMRGIDDYGIILDGVYLTPPNAGRFLQYFSPLFLDNARMVRNSSILTLGPLGQFTSPKGLPNQGYAIFSSKLPRSRGKPERKVKMGLGSYLERNLAFFVQGYEKSVPYSLGISLNGTEGKDGFHAAHQAYSLFGRTSIGAERFKLDLSLFGVFASQEIQTAQKDSLAAGSLWEYDPIKSLVGSVRASIFWDQAHTTYLAFGTNETAAELEMGSFTGPSSLRDQREHFEQLTLCHAWVLESGHTIKGGLQAFWWDSPTGQFYYEGTQRKEQLYGVFLQDEWIGLDDRLTLDGGVRLEKKHISKGIDRFRPMPGAQTYRTVSDYWEHEAFIASLGSSYMFLPGRKLLGRVAYSSQEPGSYLSLDDGEDLGSEEMIKLEAGVSSSFLDGSFSLSATPFFYHIKNYRYEAGYAGPPENRITLYDAYDVDRKGVELNLEGNVTDSFRILLNYSYLHPNRRLDRETIPNHLGSLRLRYQRPSFHANLNAKFVGPYKNNFLARDNRYHEVGDFARIDANVCWPVRLFGKEGELTVYLRNLTNQAYVTQFGFKDQGVLFGSDITLRF